MNVSGMSDALCPIVLVLSNIGLGVGLYETGILLLAVLLWFSGILVIVGIISSIGKSAMRRAESHTSPETGTR